MMFVIVGIVQKDAFFSFSLKVIDDNLLLQTADCLLVIVQLTSAPLANRKTTCPLVYVPSGFLAQEHESTKVGI